MRIVKLRRVLLAIAVTAAAFARGQEQRYSEEVTVRVIDIDVIVTDKQGKPVTNLNREDFQLFEDGKQVEIRYFSRVVDGRLAPDAAPSTTQQAAEVQPGERTPVTWIFFIDQTSMQPSRRNMTMRQLREFIERAVQEGDKSIVANNDGSATRIEQDLTMDRASLMTTLTKIEGKSKSRGGASTEGNSIRIEASRAEESDPEFEFIRDELAHRIDLIIEEEAQRTRNAITSIDAMVDSLARLEGRLAFVYVGAGFNSLPGMTLAEVWRNRFGANSPGNPRPEDHRQFIEKQITALYTKLSATRVTVYTVQAGDTWMASAELPDRTQVGGEIEGSGSEMAEAASARELAQRTGGLYFKANPELANQLERVRNDLNNYYSIGYVPQGPPGDTHRVRVKVSAEGARVRHRESVRERTRTEEAARVAVAKLVQPKKELQVAPSDANPLGVAVMASQPRKEQWTKEVILPFNFSVQLETLMFVPKGNLSHAEFSMSFAVSSPDGTIWPIETREQSLDVQKSEMPANPDMHVEYAWHVDLAPLHIPPGIPITKEGMQLTVTVEDHATGARSVVTVPIPKK